MHNNNNLIIHITYIIILHITYYFIISNFYLTRLMKRIILESYAYFY